jgi:PAS domain S-box-containing protein
MAQQADPPRPPVRAAPQPDAMFRAAADQAPQVMWIVNSKGAVTYLNRFWYELVGGAPPEGHGHAWTEHVLPEDVAQMRERWRSATAGGTVFEGTRRVRARDGTLHTLSYKASPVRDAAGRVVCWVGMDADITEIKNIETELRLANAELEAFSYSVSHDLRSPLATLQGFSQRLAQRLAGSGDATSVHYAQRIARTALHMGELVDGLLSMAQVSRGPLQREPVDLGELAAEILEQHRRSAPGRRVQTRIAPGLLVQADRRLMRSLLENLLGNAWKFTGRADPARIEVDQQGADGETVFLVRDNGAGFDMAEAGQLFGTFQRLHPASDFPGTGIGLATALRIVSRHQGRIWAQAAPGRGCTFFFTLGAVQ